MQETICIPYYSTADFTTEEISTKTELSEHYTIDKNIWDSKLEGQAKFEIGYVDNALLVKFIVIEENIRAIYTQSNNPVHRDSYVELFISLEDEENYYNFEFKCKGTCLAGFGTSRDDRTSLSIKAIESSSTFKSVLCNDRNMIQWELMLKIPTSSFQFHQIDSFKKKSACSNFYKCGDDLPKPHFLSWKPSKSETPNFHLRDFFGKAIFQ